MHLLLQQEQSVTNGVNLRTSTLTLDDFDLGVLQSQLSDRVNHASSQPLSVRRIPRPLVLQGQPFVVEIDIRLDGHAGDWNRVATTVGGGNSGLGINEIGNVVDDALRRIIIQSIQDGFCRVTRGIPFLETELQNRNLLEHVELDLLTISVRLLTVNFGSKPG